MLHLKLLLMMVLAPIYNEQNKNSHSSDILGGKNKYLKYLALNGTRGAVVLGTVEVFVAVKTKKNVEKKKS